MKVYVKDESETYHGLWLFPQRGSLFTQSIWEWVQEPYIEHIQPDGTVEMSNGELFDVEYVDPEEVEAYYEANAPDFI